MKIAPSTSRLRLEDAVPSLAKRLDSYVFKEIPVKLIPPIAQHGRVRLCIPTRQQIIMGRVDRLGLPNAFRVLLGLAVISLGAALAGCSNVQPWERGNLAKPQMALDPNPGQSRYMQHLYDSREASSGGGAAKGGGCGCL